MRDLEQMQARAIEWHVRLRDGAGDDWEAFSDWLAEDPGHGEAYERIEALDLAIDPLLPDLDFREAANDRGLLDAETVVAEHQRSSWSRRWIVGGFVAAAASVAAVIVIAPPTGTDRYRVQTAAGERRTVTLDPETRVVLNGGTIMQFDRNDARFASLVAGEALFRVRHDEAKPFTLHVGDKRVRDAGTVFNVVKAPVGIRVAVSEGKVIYNPDAEKVALAPGQTLVAPAGNGNFRVEQVSTDAVGAWERGRFIYNGEPLSQVAADLERSLGVSIAVDPAIANRAVSGSIMLDGKGPSQIERLKHALDVSIIAGPAGWTMKPAPGAPR
jgi:transmembrane sensor